MSVTKIMLLTIIAYANCRFIDTNYLMYIDSEGSFLLEEPEPSRVRRQAKTPGVNAQAAWPIAGNPGGNTLTGFTSVQGQQEDGSFKSASAGVRFDHENGHAATLSGTHIPGAGNQVTGAGKLNLVDNKHQLDANAFITHTIPLQGKSFNTYGGGVDYMYNKKIGAGLGVQHSNFMDRTDYSAMGKWNVFREPKSSLDLTAGFQKSTSPYFPSSSWNPSIGGIYRF